MNVSVCIPTYNQALYVENAIRSSVQQSLIPLEIIVADDCSTDDTSAILQRLSLEIPILKVISQPQNMGISFNTNTCLRLASGDFIVRLDSDDCLAPDYIEKLVTMLLQHPTAGYAHAGVQEIDQNGRYLRLRRLFRSTGFQSSSEALKVSTNGYKVAANILMFTRSSLEKVNFITSSVNFAEDYHLSVSLAAAGFGNVYLDEILSYYRVWIDNSKVRQRRKLAEIIGIRTVFEEVLEPAYRDRGWDLQKLVASRTNFACIHADCLSWNYYTKEEKAELKLEINNLSSSPLSKIFVWLYSNDFGVIISIFNNIKQNIKNAFKYILIKIKR